MQEIKISELKPHPKNDYFFDDMTGQKWQEFLDSVKTSGIIEPIVCTQDKTIVSGHQRVRACKELGIDTIMCEVKIYDDENKITKDLIETNIRQRGDIGGSSTKMGNIIRELEGIYGVKNGGDRKSEGTLSPLITQKDISEQLGIDLTSYKNYKKLTTLIPELQNLVDDKISPSVASRVIAKLNPTEQEELFQKLNPNKKYTQNDIQEYINKNKALESRIIEISQEKNKTEIITQERDRPETTEMINKLRKELNEKSEEYQKLFNDLMQKQTLLNKTMGESTNWQLTSHCSEITKKMLDFVNEMAKYGYMAETFNEIPIATRNEYLRCVKAVRKWTDNIIDEIEDKNNYIEIEGE